MLVGGNADRATDVRRVARSGLRFVSLVARSEHDHRLAVRGRDDVAGVRGDARSLRERPEIEGFEVRELGVLALDVHDRLASLRDLAVVERRDVKLMPGRHPERCKLPRDLEDLARDRLIGGPVQRGKKSPSRVEPPLGAEVAVEERVGARAVAVMTGAHVQDRERLVGPDDDRVGMLLEDLHGDAVVTIIALEDQLRAREVDVALVAGADLLDRQAEDVRAEALGDDHRSRTCS